MRYHGSYNKKPDFIFLRRGEYSSCKTPDLFYWLTISYTQKNCKHSKEKSERAWPICTCKQRTWGGTLSIICSQNAHFLSWENCKIVKGHLEMQNTLSLSLPHSSKKPPFWLPQLNLAERDGVKTKDRSCQSASYRGERDFLVPENCMPCRHALHKRETFCFSLMSEEVEKRWQKTGATHSPSG